MNRLAGFIAEHTWKTWFLAITVAIGSAILALNIHHGMLEKERIAMLEIEAERCALEIMSKTLNGNLMGALELMGIIDSPLKKEALDEIPPDSQASLQLLETIARTRHANGAFVVGLDGVIRSSWAKGKSSSGQNVKFRPYFQTAVKGMQSVYAAVGTTTGKRTLYFATPLYKDSNTASPVTGAVVGRGAVEPVDRLLAGKTDVALLLSPQNVVFSANRPELAGSLVGAVTPELMASLRETKQFGDLVNSRNPAVLPVSLNGKIRSFEGRRHAAATVNLKWNDPLGDWKLLLMEDLSRSVPLQRSVPVAFLAGVLLLLTELLLLNMLRNHHAKVTTGYELELYTRAREASATHRTRMAAATMQMQKSETVQEVASFFLAESHSMFNILQGVVYLLDDTGKKLSLAASYACSATPPETIHSGEGLLGQSFTDRRSRLIKTRETGCNYMMIRSGLGETCPASIMTVPLILGSSTVGVAEVAMLVIPGSDEREQIEKLAELLAMNIEIIRRRKQVTPASPEAVQ